MKLGESRRFGAPAVEPVPYAEGAAGDRLDALAEERHDERH